jgi:hypothetical protein
VNALRGEHAPQQQHSAPGSAIVAPAPLPAPGRGTAASAPAYGLGHGAAASCATTAYTAATSTRSPAGQRGGSGRGRDPTRSGAASAQPRSLPPPDLLMVIHPSDSAAPPADVAALAEGALVFARRVGAPHNAVIDEVTRDAGLPMAPLRDVLDSVLRWPACLVPHSGRLGAAGRGDAGNDGSVSDVRGRRASPAMLAWLVEEAAAAAAADERPIAVAQPAAQRAEGQLSALGLEA